MKNTTGPADVEAYLARQPDHARAVLANVRALIRNALPDAGECISYGIPAFRSKAGVIIFYAGWKRHFSLYPASEAVRAGCGEALAGLEISKGTIRFPLDAPVPNALIARIAALRGEEIAARAAAKKPGNAANPA
ncbi:MAG: DUF1801 domain-containing protein [Rhizobiaceae bacterium]